MQQADEVETTPRLDLNEDELRAKLRKLAETAPDSLNPPARIEGAATKPPRKPSSMRQITICVLLCSLFAVTVGLDNLKSWELSAYDALADVAQRFGSSVVSAYDWTLTGVHYRAVTAALFLIIVVYLVIGALCDMRDGIAAYFARRSERAWQRKVELERASRPVPIYNTQTVSPYFRKKNMVHGDARPADDFEVDQGLRDHIGGHSPMFED